MIIRNVDQEEVRRGTFQAHGGGSAMMLFDNSLLQGILFLAQGVLKPGRMSEPHIDPYEEIYYVLKGEGLMRVDDDERRVSAGDAVWIPHGAVHSFFNDSNEDCEALVIAAMPSAYSVRNSS